MITSSIVRIIKKVFVLNAIFNFHPQKKSYVKSSNSSMFLLNLLILLRGRSYMCFSSSSSLFFLLIVPWSWSILRFSNTNINSFSYSFCIDSVISSKKSHNLRRTSSTRDFEFFNKIWK